MSAAFSPVAVVPTYENPLTIGVVARGLRGRGLPVIVVDDGSGPAGAAACAALADEGLATVVRRERNGGKGAAFKAGLERAAALGHTHALQVDGDGQHDLDATERFLALAREHPDALVLGRPEYGDDAPTSRTFARRFTRFWVDLETGRRQRVDDALVGFRVYPVETTRRCRTWSDRMGYDVEIVVRLVRVGVPVVNAPVGVRYLAPEEGGVSHFRMLRDNLAFSWLHCRLCTLGALGWLRRLATGGGTR